jgi:hypothetical protein
MKVVIIISLILIVSLYAFQNKETLAEKLKEMLGVDPDPVIDPDPDPDPDPVIDPVIDPDPDPVIDPVIDPDPDPVVESNVLHLEKIGTYKPNNSIDILAVKSPNGSFYHAVKIGTEPYNLHVKGFNFSGYVNYLKSINFTSFDKEATANDGITMPESFGTVLVNHTYKNDSDGKYFRQNGMFQYDGNDGNDGNENENGNENDPKLTGGGVVGSSEINIINALDEITSFDTSPEDSINNPAFFAKSVKASNLSGNEEILDLYDYNPIIYQKTGSLLTHWKQAYIYATNRTSTYEKHGGTYFVKPKYTPTDSILMDFDIAFPNFTLPSGKWNIMQCQPLRDKNVSNYLRKGCSLVRNHAIKGKMFKFLSDAMFYELGCPQAYQSSQLDMDEWCSTVSASDLLQSFKKHILPFVDYGEIMINGEAINHRWRVDRYKIVNCFKWWAESKKLNNYKAKLSVWNFAAIKFSRSIMSANRSDIRYEEALNFTGSLGEFRNKFSSILGFENEDIAEYLDIFHVGGYTNSVEDELTLHHYLLEYEYNKKYFPEKLILKTHWNTIELLPNGVDRLAIQEVRAGILTYIRHVKPQVLTSDMYNIGSWSVGVCDGQDGWYDPFFASDNKLANGWDGKKWDGTKIGTRYIDGAEYPKGNLSNEDMKMSGIWAASQNNDIVNAPGSWTYVINPAKSMRESLPIVSYKTSGSAVLVKAVDTFAETNEIKRFGVDISSELRTVETNGNFTSEIRF